MGVFDVRCGVSRISTMWRPEGARRVTCSMFLMEHAEQGIVPWTPPIRGTYDRYGGIELWAEDRSQYTQWAEDRLWSVWQSGALKSSWPEDVDRHHDPRRSRLEVVLHHGAETAYNGVKLKIDGRRVEACIVHDAVAEAIAAADPAPPKTLEAALVGWFPEGGAGRRHFADPPEDALPQLARYACVWGYAQAHGGMQPIRSRDARQHDEGFIRRTVRAAGERDEGPLRGLCGARARAPARGGAGEGQAGEAAARSAYESAIKYMTPRAYTPSEWFMAGEVMDHAKFGLGLVEAEIDEHKIRVRFAEGTRVLVQRRE